VIKEKNYSVDVREAACTAAGECAKGAALQGDGFKTLEAAVGEDEDRIWKAASYALGKAPNVISKPMSEFNFQDNRALKSYLDGSRFVRTTGMHFTPMREVFEKFSRRIPAPA